MKKLILTVILQVVFAAVLQAAEITLDECVTLARSNYPTIKKLEIIRITENCDLTNASSSWLPSVRLGIWAGWLNRNPDIKDLYSNTKDAAAKEYYRKMFEDDWNVLSPIPWEYSGRVEISQNIYDGGLSSALKGEAKAKAELQESEVSSTLEVVEKKVEELYFSILLLTDRKKQMDVQMEVLERNKKKLSDLERSGNGSALSVKMIQAEIISLNQQENVLKGNLTAYQQSLSLFVGKDISHMELQLPEIPDVDSKSIYDTPAMKMIDSRINMVRASMKMLDASLKPQITLVGEMSYGYPGRSVFKSVVNHNPELNLAFGIKMAWNLTPFYTRKNDALKLQNQIRLLDIERESLLLNTHIENSSLNSRIFEIKNTLKQDDELVTLRKEIRQIEEARLENGMIDTGSFLDKVSDETKAALGKSIHSIELLQCYRNLKSLRR